MAVKITSDGVITGLTDIDSDLVSSSDIQDGAITNVKLASDLDAGKLTTGTLPEARIASLAASKLTGTVSDAQIASMSASKLTGSLPALNGSALTGLNSYPNCRALPEINLTNVGGSWSTTWSSSFPFTGGDAIIFGSFSVQLMIANTGGAAGGKLQISINGGSTWIDILFAGRTGGGSGNEVFSASYNSPLVVAGGGTGNQNIQVRLLNTDGGYQSTSYVKLLNPSIMEVNSV